MDKNINDINRDVWLFLLDSLDLKPKDYWYLLGMLDVVLPEDNNIKFGNSPIIDYLYKIKVSNKKGDYDGFKSKN